MQTVKRVCAVCGADSPRQWLRPKQSPGPVVKCGQCGFVYVSPIESLRALIQDGPVTDVAGDPLRESADLDDLRGRWEEAMIASYMAELPAKQENAAEVLGRIERLIPSRGSILDFGCFCGVFLSVAAARGWECWGLEPLIGPSIHARGKFGLKVVTDTLRADTFAPGQFDVVTAFQVFEHLVDPDRELETLTRFLRPGGLMVIEVPNIATPLVTLLGGRHRHFVQDHVSLFSARTLSQLMGRFGLRVRQVYYPARALSVRHGLWWLGRLGLPIEWVNNALPGWLLSHSLRLSVGDIVTVIGEKT